jgi:hypothetical protein
MEVAFKNPVSFDHLLRAQSDGQVQIQHPSAAKTLKMRVWCSVKIVSPLVFVVDYQ